MIMISVYDKKAAQYLGPVPFDHISAAIRNYVMFVRSKPDAVQVQFSEDYDLYEVGGFDAHSGALTPVIPPSFIESMIHIVAQARKEVSNG